VGADGLDPRAGDAEVDDVVISPEGDSDPRPGRSEPELFALHGEVARGRHDPVELHRAASIDRRDRRGVGVLAEWFDWLDRGIDGCGRRGGAGLEIGGQPQRYQLLGVGALLLAGGEPLRRVAHLQGLVGAVTVVAGDIGVDRSLGSEQGLEGFGVVEELPAQGFVEALHLPGGGR
jgi:hypothetical protein